MDHPIDGPWELPSVRGMLSQADEFTPFLRLPAEIRCKIWQAAFPPNIFPASSYEASRIWNGTGIGIGFKGPIAPLPATARVNQEAHAETLRVYPKISSTPSWQISGFINYEVDTMGFSCYHSSCNARKLPAAVLQNLQRITIVPRCWIHGCKPEREDFKTLENFLRYVAAKYFPSLRHEPLHPPSLLSDVRWTWIAVYADHQPLGWVGLEIKILIIQEHEADLYGDGEDHSEHQTFLDYMGLCILRDTWQAMTLTMEDSTEPAAESQVAPTFHPFPRLPLEIRRQIWQATWLPDRVNLWLLRTPSPQNNWYWRRFWKRRLPATAHVNRESRSETMRKYYKIPNSPFLEFNARINELDALLFEPYPRCATDYPEDILHKFKRLYITVHESAPECLYGKGRFSDRPGYETLDNFLRYVVWRYFSSLQEIEVAVSPTPHFDHMNPEIVRSLRPLFIRTRDERGLEFSPVITQRCGRRLWHSTKIRFVGKCEAAGRDDAEDAWDHRGPRGALKYLTLCLWHVFRPNDFLLRDPEVQRLVNHLSVQFDASSRAPPTHREPRVNHESRHETLRKYSRIPTFPYRWPLTTWPCDARDVVNYEIDTVCFRCCALQRVAASQYSAVLLQKLQRIDIALPCWVVYYSLRPGHKTFDNFLRYVVAAYFPSLRELTAELDPKVPDHDAEFKPYLRLPHELRLKIWRATWEPEVIGPYDLTTCSRYKYEPIIELDYKLPITSQVNHESREETLRKYERVPNSSTYIFRAFMNPEIDRHSVDCMYKLLCPSMTRAHFLRTEQMILETTEVANDPFYDAYPSPEAIGYKTLGNFLFYAKKKYFATLRELHIDVPQKFLDTSEIREDMRHSYRPMLFRSKDKGGVHIEPVAKDDYCHGFRIRFLGQSNVALLGDGEPAEQHEPWLFFLSGKVSGTHSAQSLG
ncbi:hypothetical protein PG994_009687 [Apiospora phragmitis]|uniref:2EXR domain-containing protein n=1 Tax=Apiospora phragmitis TaxID=2905665 RepID=A0ABR1U952_9PEZI